MTSAIGIRVYRVSVHKRGDTKLLSFDNPALQPSVKQFISDFIASHTTLQQHTPLERSWYFAPEEEDEPGTCKGYIRYGTFGFESTFVDSKTQKVQYDRGTSDVEVIPLYYEFWCPDNVKYGLVAFQSFQGRSCITLVMQKFKDIFEKLNKDYYINFKKLMPSDKGGGIYAQNQVKKLRLIRKRASGDIVERYVDTIPPDEIDFQIVMSARRTGTFGRCMDVIDSLNRDGQAVIMHDGIEFDEAVAEVSIGGGKLKRVGVFGPNADTGVIDVTNDVGKGSDGHPPYESLVQICVELLRSFHETIKGAKS